jgi:hypothetical protein
VWSGATTSGYLGNIPTLKCPSDGTRVGAVPPDRQAEYALNNYGVGMGDNFNLDFANKDPLMRGLFGFESAIKLAAVADGTSNTMAMAEILVAPAESRLGRAIGNNTNNPLACRASLVNGEYVTGTIISQTRCHGNRWNDGRPQYVGVNNILPPNGATCSTQSNSGIYSVSSAHTGRREHPAGRRVRPVRRADHRHREPVPPAGGGRPKPPTVCGARWAAGTAATSWATTNHPGPGGSPPGRPAGPPPITDARA